VDLCTRSWKLCASSASLSHGALKKCGSLYQPHELFRDERALKWRRICMKTNFYAACGCRQPTLTGASISHPPPASMEQLHYYFAAAQQRSAGGSALLAPSTTTKPQQLRRRPSICAECYNIRCAVRFWAFSPRSAAADASSHPAARQEISEILLLNYVCLPRSCCVLLSRRLFVLIYIFAECKVQ
jgi:hypothetical protein